MHPPDKLLPWRFDKERARWVQESSARDMTVSTVTLVTYNVWFAGYAFAERCEAMLRILRETDADIIALQEVTEEFLERALREEWIKDHYQVSDATRETVRGYGVVLFSRLPMVQLVMHDLPSGMRRRLLVAAFRVSGRDLAVATVHLESLRESTPYRAHQLREIFSILKGFENVVLMGDFNFCSSWDENDNIDPAYVDLWPLLRPDEAGYTEDAAINVMGHGKDRPSKAVRFDRILVRATPGALKAKEIRLLGTEPISAKYRDKAIFPSDHFGLRTVLVLEGGRNDSR